jgi:hypothetical protein
VTSRVAGERYTVNMTIVTPETRDELVIALLDPLGRKTSYGSRVVRIPDWVDEGEKLIVHGPPLPNAPLRVVLPRKIVEFDVRGGAVEFEEFELFAA